MSAKMIQVVGTLTVGLVLSLAVGCAAAGRGHGDHEHGTDEATMASGGERLTVRFAF